MKLTLSEVNNEENDTIHNRIHIHQNQQPCETNLYSEEEVDDDAEAENLLSEGESSDSDEELIMKNVAEDDEEEAIKLEGIHLLQFQITLTYTVTNHFQITFTFTFKSL